MKKLLYSLTLISFFVNLNLFSLEPNEMTFDNLDKVQDAMDDSGDMKDTVAPTLPKVVDVSNQGTEKSVAPVNLENKGLDADSFLSHMLKNHPDLKEENNKPQPMPELTERDIKDDIKIHKNIAAKQSAIQHILEDLVKKLSGRFNYRPEQYSTQLNTEDNLSEVEHALIKKMKRVSTLCHKAADAHDKVAMIYESFQDFEKVDLEPGEKLRAIVVDLSKNATGASSEADKEMEELLGLKPIMKF